jgi:diguanylate cyclase (GGDEF)-like protein
LDKLNERTSELEKTHARLQTIYETSRSLTELMSVENVIDRLLQIARSVLDYPVCEIYTWETPTGTLWLNGRVDHLQTSRLKKPERVELTDLLRRAIEGGEIGRVTDRHAGRSIIDGNPNRSRLIVPMISEGKVIGLLSAESPNPNAFSEHDEQVLAIMAASTAMSLVNADLHQRMEKLTVIDELTGAYNYRYFRGRLEDERRRAVRYGQPLSLVMVDIDWFKRLNDEFGHENGNIALRKLTQVIASCIRDVDILARYGGEEFIIILPQTGGTEARVIGERIRAQVERTEFGPTLRGEPLHMTVSIGISCYPDNGRPENELVETVDKALYNAKGRGKNLVCTT